MCATTAQAKLSSRSFDFRRRVSEPLRLQNNKKIIFDFCQSGIWEFSPILDLGSVLRDDGLSYIDTISTSFGQLAISTNSHFLIVIVVPKLKVKSRSKEDPIVE